MLPHSPVGLSGPYAALVLGGRSGIGAAIADLLKSDPELVRLHLTSRDPHWTEDATTDLRVRRHRADLSASGDVARISSAVEEEAIPLRLVINATGLLHDGDLQPERSWRELDPDHLRRLMDVHAVGYANLVQHVLPRMPRDGRALFATLSARVGSIEDNALGGWYSYRASKAAQNMLVRCAAIEARRRHPHLMVVALHPGTVRTPLSYPFTTRLRPGHRLLSPPECASYLFEVLAELEPEDTGSFRAWDGECLPW